jgi:hypothetical protein
MGKSINLNQSLNVILALPTANRPKLQEDCGVLPTLEGDETGDDKGTADLASLLNSKLGMLEGTPMNTLGQDDSD